MTTPNRTAAVNPSAESLDLLAAATDDDAIAMLNLLRYSPGDGAQRYRRYAAVATETITARGGSLLYLGNVIDDLASWNTAANYPAFRAASGVDDPAVLARIEECVLMGRLGDPREVAHFCASLLDGESRFQTGQFFSLSGGWSD